MKAGESEQSLQSFTMIGGLRDRHARALQRGIGRVRWLNG
jgi:hypothetical protein